MNISEVKDIHLFFTGTFHMVYKKACKYRPMDCVLVEIKKA